MERVKEFKHYTIVVKLSKNAGYWIRSMPAEKFERLKTFTVRGHKYEVVKDSLFTMHGWYPWLKFNPWNAWREVYNMLYRFFVPAGMLIFEEPEDPLHGVEIAIKPITWEAKTLDKWSPSLVQAVLTSRLEEKYTRHVKYGNMGIDWKVVLIVGVIAVVALLFITGRIP